MVCDTIIAETKRLYAGVDFSDPEDAFAFDVIKEVGPCGNFLMEDHTLERYSDFCYPNYIDRNLYPKWKEQGALDMNGACTKAMQEILRKHEAVPLPTDVIAAIDEVIAKAEARAKAEEEKAAA